jgi:aminoglycoside phosphotransferase (APT) family kinase protein
MSTATELGQTTSTAILDDLQRFARLPDWLSAIDDAERVRDELARSIPEFATGALTLLGCEIKRARMKKQIWTLICRLTTTDPAGGARRVVELRGTLLPPTQPEPQVGAEPQQPLGSAEWRIYVPALRLKLELQPADEALPALPVLTDPEQARALLEQSIRAGSPAYADLRIQSCEPKIMRYKPGSRCTILYRLGYAPEDAGRNWADIVVAKTYHGDKGRIAYEGMRALWDSALASNGAVTIAEPLAFIPEMNVLVQGPIREEQTLQDLIRSALHAGTPEARAELDVFMRKAARGLAELHRSAVLTGERRVWEDEFAEVREDVDRLVAATPQLDGAAEALLARLFALAAAHPADAPVPTHGTFRPAQVLLYHGQIGFIDFDGFCQAEPALDLALFLGKIQDIGVNAPESDDDDSGGALLGAAEQQALLEQTESICETFLAEYERHLPITRQRIALWGALNLLTLVLHCWTKVKPERLAINLMLLERYLRVSGVLA